jgi:hypothetical protein
MRHLADPVPDFGPLFELPEREGPNITTARRFFEGPQEDVSGRREFRLAGQLADIFAVLRSGEWFTLEELSRKTDAPPASVSAQIRHLRKARWGSFVIDRRHVGGGLYEYRLALDANGKPLRRQR